METDLTTARASLAGAVEAMLAEREQQLRDDFNRDLALLPQRLDEERTAKLAEAAAALDAARDAKVQELEALGQTHAEAVAQADAERAAALAAATADLDRKRSEREAELSAKLKKKLEGDLKDVAHMRANGARILDVGLEAFKQQQHDLLAQKAAEVRPI